MATISLNLNAKGVKQGAKEADQAFDKVKKSAKETESQVEKSNKKIGSSFSSMGSVFKIAGAAIVAQQAGSIALSLAKITSNAEEMQSKSEVVFGKFIPDVRKQLGEFAAAANRSAFELEGMASTIQDTFVPMGFARGEAAKLSVEMTKLATDMASFNNASDVAVMEALQSAIVGNHETMRQFGVVITQTTLNQQLLTMGIEGGVKAATEQEKVQARLNIIMAGTVDAQGDAIATSDSLANKVKGLTANFEQLAIKIGQELMPEFNSILDGGNNTIAMFERMAISVGFLPEFGRGLSGVSAQMSLLTSEIGKLEEAAGKKGGLFTELFKGFMRGGVSLTKQAEMKLNLLDTINKTTLADELTKQNTAGFQAQGASFKEKEAQEENEWRERMFEGEKQDQAVIQAYIRHGHILNLFRLKDIEKREDAEIESQETIKNSYMNMGALRVQSEKDAAAKSILTATQTASTIKEVLTPEMQGIIDLSKSIGSSFESAMMSAAKGTLTLKDAFKTMANDVIGELYRIFVVKQITGFVESAVLGAFGVSPPPEVGGSAAFGGPVSAGRGVVVGERGPEVFFPNSNGVIAPNNSVSGGEIIINQNINVTTGVQQTVRAEILGLMPQISAASKSAVLDAKRRGGAFAGAF